MPFLYRRSVPPARDTAKWTHWLKVDPVLALRRKAPASHTYRVPLSMLTPIAAGYAPTEKTRGQLEGELVWYWYHSTVKSPVPTAQSALAGEKTNWFVPLNEILPPFTAEVLVTTPKMTRTAAAAAMNPLGLLMFHRILADPISPAEAAVTRPGVRRPGAASRPAAPRRRAHGATRPSRRSRPDSPALHPRARDAR